MKKSLIIFNWRDPQHPNAGGSEEYFLNYGRELIKKGWRVTWLTSRVRGKKRNEKMEGIYIKRRGGFITKHILIPIQYILFENKHCTHIIDSENGMPFFTPLFSRKKIFLLVHHVHQDIQTGNKSMIKVIIGATGTIVAGLLSTIVVLLINFT